jgi:hypothetical protein
VTDLVRIGDEVDLGNVVVIAQFKLNYPERFASDAYHNRWSAVQVNHLPGVVLIGNQAHSAQDKSGDDFGSSDRFRPCFCFAPSVRVNDRRLSQ